MNWYITYSSQIKQPPSLQQQQQRKKIASVIHCRNCQLLYTSFTNSRWQKYYNKYSVNKHLCKNYPFALFSIFNFQFDFVIEKPNNLGRWRIQEITLKHHHLPLTTTNTELQYCFYFQLNRKKVFFFSICVFANLNSKTS